MKTIHDHLFYYLSQYCCDPALVKQILIDNGLHVFFTDYLHEQESQLHSSPTYHDPIILAKKLRFYKYQNALSQIKSLFDTHGIVFAVMKGLAIATELYGDKPYLRDFSDMDLLISPLQASLALSLLKSIGYISEAGDKEISAELFMQSGDREHHFPPLIRKEKQLFHTILEVHIGLVPSWIFHIKHPNTEQVLARTYVNKFDIPVMDNYDTVLFMMLHLMKHYVYPMVMEFAVGNTDAHIDLRSLHEIAIFIYQKKELLFKTKLEERLSEYEARNELAFICNILREIYPPLNYLLDIHFPEDTRSCFSSRFSCIALTKIKISDILLGNRRSIICRCIKELQKDAFTLMCYPKKIQKDISDIKHQKISIDGIHFYEDNHFGTYKNVMEMGRTAIQRGIFFVEWDPHYFWFSITVKDKNLIFPQYDESNNKPTIAGQDYIRLHFDTGRRGEHEAFVRGFVLKPQYMSNGSLHLVMREDYYLNGADTVINENIYQAEITSTNNSYTIQIGIPWHILGYEPYAGFSFFFDVQMWDYDENMDDFVVLAWQNANKAWYDITTYGRVNLTAL